MKNNSSRIIKIINVKITQKQTTNEINLNLVPLFNQAPSPPTSTKQTYNNNNNNNKTFVSTFQTPVK